MGIKVLDITKYAPKSTDVFLFDTNIWMFLFCPIGSTRMYEQKIYSSFLQSVKTSRGSIFINSLILSEFSNAFLRLDFNLWKKANKQNSLTYKKDYVGTPRYRDTVKLVTYAINSILGLCNKGSDNLDLLEIEKVLRHLQFIDFNDSYYLELSSFSKYKIVTDDHDFINFKIHDQEILTIVNRKY
jgi:hypothetical protein